MQWHDIKTSSNLRAFIENAPDESHFFSRNTMRFFGDTMRNFGIRKHENGRIVELYRRRPVKHGLMGSTFWSCSPDGSYAIQEHDYAPDTGKGGA